MHRARTVVELVGLVSLYAKLRFRRESQKEDLWKPGAGVRRSRVRGTRHGRDVLPFEPALSGYVITNDFLGDNVHRNSNIITRPSVMVTNFFLPRFFLSTVSPPVVKEPGWSAWGSWGRCTAKCGGGVRQRSRYCNNPPPQEGQDCVGCSEEYELCNQKPCVEASRKVSSWTPWVPAGNGTHKRYRFSCRTQPDQLAINIFQDKEENRLCQDGTCHRLGESITRVRIYMP